MNSLLSRLVVVLVATVLARCPVAAHEDEGPLAGHSYQGDAYDEGPRQAAYLMEGMPKIDFPVTTKSAQAQKFFNQGVGQLHGFWYFEAERSFRQVQKLDTNCVMAGWGLAMANVSNEKRARDFIQQAVARTNSTSVTRREQLYIESLAKFYPTNKSSAKKDAKTAANPATNAPAAPKPADDAEAKRHRDYVKSLEQIVEEFPDDIEAKALLVFKIWENGGRSKISSHIATDALAKDVLAASPMHPVHHARIHFWNNEADRRALESAARCGQGSPGIAHMWHMPGHSYSALHRYADGAWQQEASARVDHAYMMHNRVLPDQIHNFAHNNDWLVKNLNNVGRVRDALDLAKNMIELPRHPKFNSLPTPPANSATNTSTNTSALYASIAAGNQRRENSASYGRARLLETLVTWELWDETIALADTMYLEPTDLPQEQGRRLRVLGLAHLARGDVAKGKEQISMLETMLRQFRTERHTAADDAEARAKKEKKTDEQVAKAMSDAMQSFADRIKSIERYVAELQMFATLAQGDRDAAKKLAEDVKDLSKERLARLWFQLGDTNKAIKLAAEAVTGATNQVQALANQADILARSGKQDEAAKAFTQLQKLSAQADLDLPVLQRLQPLAQQLKLSADWRPPFKPASDVGQRPSLESLGPFRWQPMPAPDWKLSDQDAKQISLKDYRGRPVVVIFYLGYGCKHCLEQLNAFAPMTKRFAEAGISLVAVSSDSVAGLGKTFEQSTSGDGFPFPIVANPTMDVFKKYRAFDDFENSPLHGTFLVDGAGLVRWQDISFDPFIQVDFLLAEAQRLLKLPASPTLVTSARKATASSKKGAELLATPR